MKLRILLSFLLPLLASCAGIRDRSRGHEADERILATLREQVRFEMVFEPNAVVKGQSYDVKFNLRNVGGGQIDACINRGVSVWYGTAENIIFPIVLYGPATDVSCADPIKLRRGEVRSFEQRLLVPKPVPLGLQVVTASLDFNYCGDKLYGCAYSYLYASKQVIVEAAPETPPN